jgi:hypothetical protein
MKQKGWKMIWIVLALQLVVPAASGTQYDSPAMVEKVTKAVPTDELIVVVHQRPEFVESTVSLLDQPRYANSPRVMLTDGAGYPLTPSLVDRATMVQYSLLGELSLNVDAKTVTLIGGSANDCLRTSGQLLIKEMLDHRKRQKLTIRIPSDVVWGWKQEAGGFTLYDSFCRGNAAEFDSKVKEFAETFIKDMNFPDPFSITQIYQIEPGRAGAMDYYFVFARKSDGKQVKLVIEQLCDVS